MREQQMTMLGRTAALILLVIMLGSRPAAAKPHDFNFNLTSGLINVPAARVLPVRHYQLSFYDVFMDEPAGAVLGDDNERAVIGALPGLELGVNMLSSNLEFAFSFQYCYHNEQLILPAWVVGGQNVFGAGEDPAGSVFQYRARPSYYLGATKAVNPAVAFSLGVGNGRFKGLWGGLEWQLHEDLKFLVDNSGEGPNYGAVYNFGNWSWGGYYLWWAGSSGLKQFPAISVAYYN